MEKKLILLHSNDMHGDFLSEKIGDFELGGVSMLSGYINKVRKSAENVIYCVSGDMLQGSLIDSEFRGLSTIEIMNYLSPDIASLGNHEIDYGLGHLLLLEKCAKFPIVNADIFIKNPYTRLFQSHKILYVNGMKIMFIGIITNEVLSPLKKDTVLGNLIDVEEAAEEVGKICNSYRLTDIDLTILLTHIGFEEDKKLAALLDPEWGVDLIIGGHSHTVLEKPEEINDIVIAQAGVGTDQIGRFDIIVDMDTNTIAKYKWKLVPIDNKHCPRDKNIEETIVKYKKITDDKYEAILCWLPRVLTHPKRNMETELGNLFCDAVQECLQLDIIMLGSGSIRKTELGPIVTRGNLLEVMPYEEQIYRLKVTGKQFKQMYAYMLRDEALTGEHTEFYQFSKGLSVEYDKKTKTFKRFDYLGKPIKSRTVYTVGMQGYHYINFEEFFGFPIKEVKANGKPLMVSTSVLDILEEYFLVKNKVDANIEDRLKII